MKLIKFISAFIFIIATGAAIYAQPSGKKLSIAVSAVYTTSAKIYLNPNSSDVLLRNDYFLLENITNPAINIRYHLFEDLLVGLSSEYMKKSAIGRNLTVFSGSTTLTIPVDDGFTLIPIELSVYYLLPFSSDQFVFLMGGGIGYYIGEHLRKFGDATVENISRNTAYGIHVNLSMDYLFRSNVSLRAEMKFRDPQFRVRSKYNSTTVKYEGNNITLGQDSFDSKINVDGVTFMLGAAFYF